MSNVILDTSRLRICQTCGYDLRGLVGDRCPECGERFDPVPPAQIPWLKRAATGTWRAYWLTVGMVMFHPRRFGAEIWNAPRLHPAAAQRFRIILIAQVMISTIIVAATVCWGNAPSPLAVQLRWIASMETVCVVALAVFLIVATDLVQEDSWQRALNHYACAPLALAPAGELILMLVAKLHGPFEAAAALVLAIILGWWCVVHVLVMYVVKRSMLASIGHALMLPMGMFVLMVMAVLCGVAAASLVDLVLSQWL